MVDEPPRTGGRVARGIGVTATAIVTARDLVSLTKPRVTLLVVLTALGGVVLAPTAPPLLAVFLFLAATFTVVGSANALNCWMERDSDRHMDRTRDRPLPSGRMSSSLALGFGIALGIASLPILALAANPLTALLAAVALVSYVWLYTPLKRRSPAALWIGSVPGALPPLMGWTAATGRIDAGGVALFLILFLWQVPHFLAIALYRREDYARAGLRALPVVAGEAITKRRIVQIAFATWAATLLPVALGIAGLTYGIAAFVLGAGFVAVALRGLRPDAGERWARKLFLASLVHLSLLVLALAVDVALR